VLETVAAGRGPDPGTGQEAVWGLGLVERERVRAGPVTVPAGQELAVEPVKTAALERRMAVVLVAAPARVQAVAVLAGQELAVEPVKAAARAADWVAQADRVPAATATFCFSSWK